MSVLSTAKQLEGAKAELARSYDLSPYEAIDAAWLALLKTANLCPGDDEIERMAALLQRMPLDGIRPILLCAAVDALLNLSPPLESLLTAPHEEIEADRTARQFDVVRAKRETAPHEALTKLVSVLRRVRNRRMHGFKTPDAPRDQEILTAATSILQQLGGVGLEAIKP
jgi:hypothetical protein